MIRWIREWLRRIETARLVRRAVRRARGYVECPNCQQQTLKWVKEYIFHPEEPPIFGHWQCMNQRCGVSSDVLSMPWADKIAQELGYPTYTAALDDVARKRGLV